MLRLPAARRHPATHRRTRTSRRKSKEAWRTPEDYLRGLQRELEQIEKQRKEVLANDALVLKEITSARQEAQILEVAARQRSALITQ